MLKISNGKKVALGNSKMIHNSKDLSDFKAENSTRKGFFSLENTDEAELLNSNNRPSSSHGSIKGVPLQGGPPPQNGGHYAIFSY